MTINNKKEIKELEKIIQALDTAFELGDDCINPITKQVVLDNEYDALKQRLLTLDPNSKVLNTVTASKVETSKDKIIHNPPMTSINKCNGDEQEKDITLRKWMERCYADSGYDGFLEDIIEDGEWFSMSYKHDGIACSLIYKNGKLVSAGLRSKSGVDGINITDKTKYIAGIPQNLPSPLNLTIRGEIETYLKTFEEKNIQLETEGKETKSNARAYTAGVVNRKTALETKNMGLSFVAYNILNFENAPYSTEIERAKWAEKTLGLNFVKTIGFTYKMLKIFEENHRRCPFMIDGAVISVNNLDDQKALGNTGNKDSGNPKGKIAFKFKDEVKQTIVKDIEWATGRTGSITPVLIIDPVSLEGTQVSRCTAHNLSIIKQNKIGVGSEIEIIKSGKIIPKLHKIIKAKGELNIPKICPSCDFPTEVKNGDNNSQSLVCNNVDCPAQNIKNLNHYLKALDIKGIAEKNIERLVDAGLILKRSDFYKLTLETLLNSGITERTAVLTLARIWMIPSPEQEKDNITLKNKLKTISNITIPMEKFIASFGMDGAGKEVGKLLSKKYQDFDKIRNLTISELESIDGIGLTIAQNVVDFFSKNKKEIDALLQFITFKAQKIKSGKLDGKIFVLSGSMDAGKDFWKDKIEEQGGEVKSSVSKKTNYLVAGDGSGLKTEAAIKLSIPILTEDELENMLNS